MQNAVYKKRRIELINRLKKNFNHERGIVVLIGAFEHCLYSFRQESSFFYYTGITEPGAIVTIDLDGQSVCYVPDFGIERAKWVTIGLDLTSNPDNYGFNAIRPLGERQAGYAQSPFFNAHAYVHLIQDLQKQSQAGSTLYTLQAKEYALFIQQSIMHSIQQQLNQSFTHVVDCSPIVYQQRRCKDDDELYRIKKAIAITMQAQRAAENVIRPGVAEAMVQAALEQVFTQEGAARSSFPSIVASGVNTTILHYTDNHKIIQPGDLVVVDIGAEYQYYAADLTRTYAADRVYTKRQKEIYDLVRDAQSEIAARAKPGMFLRNPAAHEISLQHLTVNFFKQYGYEKYFPHSIGHYMGIDVHDVGDYMQPLMPGDVFTIEPGLYIREESLGVRIEDNYYMTEQGAVCLSEMLPK